MGEARVKLLLHLREDQVILCLCEFLLQAAQDLLGLLSAVLLRILELLLAYICFPYRELHHSVLLRSSGEVIVQLNFAQLMGFYKVDVRSAVCANPIENQRVQVPRFAAS